MRVCSILFSALTFVVAAHAAAIPSEDADLKALMDFRRRGEAADLKTLMDFRRRGEEADLKALMDF